MKPETKLRKEIVSALELYGTFSDRTDPCYSLMWNGVTYLSNDTRDLVDKILQVELKKNNS